MCTWHVKLAIARMSTKYPATIGRQEQCLIRQAERGMHKRIHFVSALMIRDNPNSVRVLIKMQPYQSQLLILRNVTVWKAEGPYRDSSPNVIANTGFVDLSTHPPILPSYISQRHALLAFRFWTRIHLLFFCSVSSFVIAVTCVFFCYFHIRLSDRKSTALTLVSHTCKHTREKI